MNLYVNIKVRNEDIYNSSNYRTSFLAEWQETRFLWLENQKINMKPQVSQLLGQAIKNKKDIELHI